MMSAVAYVSFQMLAKYMTALTALIDA